MKCPKCGYVSHDYLDACRKCSIDLAGFKTQVQLYALKATELNLLTIIGGAPESFNTSGGFSSNDSLFDSSMLDEVDMGGDFDITLDDDVSFAPAAGLDDPGGTSGLLSSPLPGFEDEEAPVPAATSENTGEGTLGPPTSGYATVLLDVGNLNDDDTGHGDTSPPATPPMEEPFIEADFTLDEPEPDMLSLNTSELILPADTTEIPLFDNADFATFDFPLSDSLPAETVEPALPPPEVEETTFSDTQETVLMDKPTSDTSESFMPPLLDDETASPATTPNEATLIDDPTLTSFDASLDDLPPLDTDGPALGPPPTTEITLVDETTDTVDKPFLPSLPPQENDDDAPTVIASHDMTLIDDPTLTSFDASLDDLPTLDIDEPTLSAPPTTELTLVDETTDTVDEPFLPNFPPLQTDETDLPMATSYEATLVDDPTLSGELDLLLLEPQDTAPLDQAPPADVIDQINENSDVLLLDEEDPEGGDNVNPA